MGKKDDARREDIKNFVFDFEQRHNVKIPLSSAHREDSHNHRDFGAGDFAVHLLKPDMQNLFMEEMASSGIRVIDEITVKGGRKKNIVHLDKKTTEEAGRKVYDSHKRKSVFTDAAGTIREEKTPSSFPVSKKVDQIYISEENKDIISELKVQALLKDDAKLQALESWKNTGLPEVAKDIMSNEAISQSIPEEPSVPITEKPVAINSVHEPVIAAPVQEEPRDTVDMPAAASDEIGVLEDADIQIEEQIDEVLGKASFKGGRRPSGIGVVEGARETVSLDVGESKPTNFGGTRSNMRDVIDEIVHTDTTGFGDDLGNKVTDRSVVGLIVQNAALAVATNDEVDPNYDPTKEEDVFSELTKDLDAEQFDDLMKGYVNNRHDFILAASAMNAKNGRVEEMSRYSQEHPVLSGVNTVGVLLGEAAAFSFAASSVSSAASAAIGVNAINELSTAARLGVFVGGEIVEQGLEEIVWAKYDNDYKFDPLLFGLALGAGAGIRNWAHNTKLNKELTDILDNQNGFVQLANDKSKRIIDAVAASTSDEKALALVKRLEDIKTNEGKRIISGLADRRNLLEEELVLNGIAVKKAKKGSKERKILTGKRQKLKRQLKKQDKNDIPVLKSILDGTHPRLSAKINPKLTIKKVAKGLNIPDRHLVDTESLRKFLGLDGADIADDYVFEDATSYANIMGEQLQEIRHNKRLNANESMKYVAEKLGDNYVGNALHDLASTDGSITKYLFNKGNLVSSDNPHIAAFYNWLAPDGMGRSKASKVRAIESQQRYDKIYGGGLMDLFHTHGDEMYSAIKKIDNKIKHKISSTFSPDDYENNVTEMFKKRLLMGNDDFRSQYGDEVSDIADGFADSFNKLNEDILKRAESVGVEGIDFDASKDWFHRSWDYSKARGVDINNLEDALAEGMESYLRKLNPDKIGPIDVDALKIQAKKFAFGIRNADITKVEGATKGYIDHLKKLAKKAGGENADINEEVLRLENNLRKSKAGDLADRIKIDVDIPIKGSDLKLSDLLEENFIVTQRRYNSRMSARIASAEHGLKDISAIDDWVTDAYEEEVKRLAKKGVENPRKVAEHVKEAMQNDVKSFKNGNISGLGDIKDDNASDILRFVKKYNYVRLMGKVGISSIAELGGSIAEVGVGTVLRQLNNTMIPFYKKMFVKNPEKFVDRLYDDMSAFTGIGLEDFAFSNKGLSKGERIYKGKGMLNSVEKVLDSTGRITQGTFGHIETLGRRITNNSLAISWANHYSGKGTDGMLENFFNTKQISNRALENAGMGEYNEQGKFIFNEMYKRIGEQITKHSKYNKQGNLTSLNMSSWDSNTAHDFGGVVSAQASHIYIDPDATTAAHWQSSSVGQVLNQFRTFTINATTKVAAYSVANAAQGLKRGDASETLKLGSKIFWGTTLGTLSVMLREGIDSTGSEENKFLDIFDEGVMKGAAIGLSRSSIIGNLPTLVDTVGGAFGAEPFFDKSSSIGRSRNFFNLATSPTGQVISKAGQGAVDVLKGDVKKGGMGLMKMSPFYRQLGAKQMMNFIQKED